MSSIDDMILEPIENALDSIGLMQGDLAPVKRAALGGAIGYAIAYGLKPKSAWMQSPTDKTKQVPRPFMLTASKADQANATYFPVWAIVAVPAVILGVLI